MTTTLQNFSISPASTDTTELYLINCFSGLIAASREADLRACQEYLSRFNRDLIERTESGRNLAERQNRPAEMIEIKYLLQLCLRQMRVVAAGGAERKFYEVAYTKMPRLSGGVVEPTPKWTVSLLEVDLEEG